MFNNYKIVEDEFHEKVLILYVDNFYEFGLDFKNKHSNSSMKDNINKFIKDRKIKFDGDKVALSLGGIILAVLLVVENPSSSNNNYIYLNDSIIPKNNYSYIVKTEDKNIEKKELLTEEVENIKEVISVPTETIIEEKKEEVNEKNVTIYRTSGEIVNISMNDYLIGVVGAEMPASFNIEALKAQAVIARTYALKKIENNIKLTDNVSTQSYLNNEELKNKWNDKFDLYYNKIKEAVYDTDNIVITYDGVLIDAVYHATSNGYTEDSSEVWGNSIPYLKSVDSSWDKETTPYLRTVSKDLSEVIDILGVSSTDYEIISRDDSSRVAEIVFGDKSFTGVEFRSLLGLRSTDFDIEIIDNVINITTRGYGHGVGLSQYGANYLANQGYNFEKIVKYYYNGVKLEKKV